MPFMVLEQYYRTRILKNSYFVHSKNDLNFGHASEIVFHFPVLWMANAPGLKNSVPHWPNWGAYLQIFSERKPSELQTSVDWLDTLSSYECILEYLLHL